VHDPEVEELRDARVVVAVVEVDVVRLDVAVDDAVFRLRVIEPVADLDRDLDRAADRRAGGRLAEEIAERHPVQVLHDEIRSGRRLLGHARVEHRDDVRVIHAREHLLRGACARSCRADCRGPRSGS
jgi:hypothetical protein